MKSCTIRSSPASITSSSPNTSPRSATIVREPPQPALLLERRQKPPAAVVERRARRSHRPLDVRRRPGRRGRDLLTRGRIDHRHRRAVERRDDLTVDDVAEERPPQVPRRHLRDGVRRGVYQLAGHTRSDLAKMTSVRDSTRRRVLMQPLADHRNASVFTLHLTSSSTVHTFTEVSSLAKARDINSSLEGRRADTT